MKDVELLVFRHELKALRRRVAQPKLRAAVVLPELQDDLGQDGSRVGRSGRA